MKKGMFVLVMVAGVFCTSQADLFARRTHLMAAHEACEREADKCEKEGGTNDANESKCMTKLNECLDRREQNHEREKEEKAKAAAAAAAAGNQPQQLRANLAPPAPPVREPKLGGRGGGA